MRYDLTIPSAAREAAERALLVHTEGCPAHQRVKAAIAISWEAALHVGGEIVMLKSEQATI